MTQNVKAAEALKPKLKLQQLLCLLTIRNVKVCKATR